MNEDDLADTINIGHEAYLEDLRLGKSSRSFSDLLCSAAVNLCLTYNNDELQGKLKHCTDLRKEVENGFKVIKDMWDDFSEEERDDLDSSYAFFKETFVGKAHLYSEKSEEELEEFVKESTTAKNPTVMAPVQEQTENSDERKTNPASYTPEENLEELFETAKTPMVMVPVQEETENSDERETNPAEYTLYKNMEELFKVPVQVQPEIFDELFERVKESMVMVQEETENSDERKTNPACYTLEEILEELSETAKKPMVMVPVQEETENSDERKTDSVLEKSLEEFVNESMTAKKTMVVPPVDEECSICNESLFKKPKILPCSHVFCTRCLEGSMRATSKKPGDLMPCEICRRDITIPKEGIGGLDVAEDAETVQKPAQLFSFISNTCEACSEDVDASSIPPAVIYCVDCKKSFCPECQRYHQKILKSHEVQYLDDAQNISTELAQLTITKKAAEVPGKYNHPVVGCMVTKAIQKERKRIHGFAILNKELFVIMGKSSCVEVYDSMQFSFSRRWSLMELIDPCDVVSCNENECLYILDSRAKILTVDPAGKLIKILSTGNKFGESLSVTHDNNIILTLYEERKLCEYSKDGELIHTVILPLEMLNPLHAIKLTDGDFLVSHGFHRGDLHRVCKVDKDGKLKKSFGRESGKTNQQLDCPSYLAIDESGFVMVADQRNARVLLLDSDLQFKREIISKWKHNRHWILRILLDESNNHLFVTENWGKGRITMFNLHH